MKRILFVDDDKSVLAGLRNALRARRSEWDCVFASSPELALAELERTAFDVVVSDMRMPKLDGTAVLAAAKQLQPKAVRMILSGQTELDSVMKSVFVAHVFLAKPCDTEALQKAVERSCHLLTLLERDDLKSVLGAVEMLPSAPQTYLQLTQILARQDSTIPEVAAVIEHDLALSAKLLQLSNSAFFGLPRKITSIADAVTYLGTVTLKNLALALETFSTTLRPGLSQGEMEELSRFSLRVGGIARLLSGKDKRKAEEAFLAGLLHAVGRLLPVSAETLRDCDDPYWPLLGAYLLGLWGLPHPIIEAIAYHQKPRTLHHETFELVDLLHLSHHLAMTSQPDQAPAGLDRDHLRAVGFDDPKLDEAMASVRHCFDDKGCPVSLPRKD